MKRWIMFLALGVCVNANAALYDMFGTIKDRDGLDPQGHGLLRGGQISGLIETDDTQDRFGGPSLVSFQIFVGDLTGYNLLTPSKDFYDAQNTFGEWVETNGQRTGTPDRAHTFRLFYSFTPSVGAMNMGVYSFEDNVILENIPEFTAKGQLTPHLLARAEETPVPEPSTILLIASSLLFLRRFYNDKA